MSAPGQAVTGDQFYVTHCVTADSVLDSPGYSVRAASDADPAALRHALEYPPYELPIDVWKDKPAKAHTPRRLARTRHPRQGIWVAHSAYVEKDTMGRDRSYFTHLMHLPAAVGAAEVLESWDAPGWVKGYPTGAAKVLPKAKLPAGTAVSTQAVTAFLAGREAGGLSPPAPPGPADLAATVCPVRLRENPEARRELVARFLHAVTLVAAAGEGRDRLYVHAEPGLVALLLYAAVRVLPPGFTADLTFTTFEPYHRNLRDYKLATVVGTFTGAPGKGLDPDLSGARGFGLDTVFPERSSAELRGGSPPGIAELLDLAAAGRWDMVENVHKLLGRGGEGLARVAETVARARALARLDEGDPTADDLLALQAGGVPPDRAEQVWPFVRAAALADPRVRAAFKGWLADEKRLSEFRREATAAVAAGDLAVWDTRWAVVRDVADGPQRRHQLERVLKHLDDKLPDLAPEARARLRYACHDAGVTPHHELHHLFAPVSPDELDALLLPGIPPAWQGYACFAVMGPDESNWLAEATRPSRRGMRDAVRKFLYAAPVEALGEYARHARPYLAAHPAFLADLFRPYGPPCRPLMDRLLRTKALEPGDWVKLIEAVNLYGGPWDGFLLEGDRLALLLVALGGDGVGREIWKNYLELLSPALLSPELDGPEVHAWERNVYGQLREAADRLSAAGVKLVNALPRGGVKRLFAAADLIRWVENPALGENLAEGEVRRACDDFNAELVVAGAAGDGAADDKPRLGATDMLRAAFLRGKFHALRLPDEAAALAPFVSLFRASYPIDLNFRSASTAVTEWVKLSEHCPDQTRAAFQAYLVTEYVPKDLHRAILDEPRHTPFLPAAAAAVREGLAVPERKPGGEKYRPPGGKRAGASADDDAAFAATRRAKKQKKARAKGGGCLGVVLVAGIVVAGVIAAVV